jgi:hypothetical protein
MSLGLPADPERSARAREAVVDSPSYSGSAAQYRLNKSLPHCEARWLVQGRIAIAAGMLTIDNVFQKVAK